MAIFKKKEVMIKNFRIKKLFTLSQKMEVFVLKALIFIKK